MTYQEAIHWLCYQENYTEKEICDLLNSDGDQAIINLAIQLSKEGE